MSASSDMSSIAHLRVGVVRVGDACVFERVNMVVWVQYARGFQNTGVNRGKQKAIVKSRRLK